MCPLTETRTDGMELDAYILPKDGLCELLKVLTRSGYQIVGPQMADGAIIYSPMMETSRLPHGWLDEQDGGRYRLRHDPNAGYFDYAVGPHSLKPYVFPAVETLVQLERSGAEWSVQYPEQDALPLAVFGVRSCDLHALAIQDRVFLEGQYQDPNYRKRRDRLFLIVVQCRRAAATCFCHSLQTGPRATSGFDWALTEREDHFVLEIGSVRGADVAASIQELRHADGHEMEAARNQSAELLAKMNRRAEGDAPDSGPRPRSLETAGLRELLLTQPDHPRWDEVAERCLSCTNCTMVCPTCFCSSVKEVTDLTGDHVSRERHWDSCFTADHSRVSSGVVRSSTKARYRQWLTHKLASWIDQFGTSGCVGCGRCITWCPVGIDLTEEVAALRGVPS